jgi:hypothetical protein
MAHIIIQTQPQTTPDPPTTEEIQGWTIEPLPHRLITGPTSWSTAEHLTWIADHKHLENPKTNIIIIELHAPVITHNGLDIIKHDATGWLYHENNRYALKRYNLMDPKARRKNHIFHNESLALWEILTHTEPEPLE